MLPGPVRQNGYVVEDLEQRARAWAAKGIGPWIVIPNITADEIEYRGRTVGPLEMTIALASSGDLQLELIQQHSDTPTVYREFLDAHGEGLQHLAWWTEDLDGVLERALGRGWTIAQRGVFGGTRYVYFDGPQPHTSLELLEPDDGSRYVFEQVRRAAEDWDGVTDPVRGLT